MKAIRTTSTAILALLLGIAAPAYARQGQQGEKHERSEQRQQGEHAQGKPEQKHAQQQRPTAQHPDQHQTQAHAQPRPGQNQHPTHAPQQRASIQPRHGQGQQHVRQSAWQEHRAQSWQSDHRTWQQRGGYNGYRIPDARFRGYFGPSHGFRIHGLPFLVVGGYPRFQYNGYWFSLVDPWPESWANNWYDTDDVYVNYVDGGYYLYNRRYPTTGIAINISF